MQKKHKAIFLGFLKRPISHVSDGRCENPECRNITEFRGSCRIFKNLLI